MIKWNDLCVGPTSRDWLLAIGAVIAISLLITSASWLKKHFHDKEEILRKGVHFAVGIAAAFAPLYFKSALLLLLIAFLFGLIDFYAIRNGLLQGIHGHRYSYGTVYFPLAYMLLILFCWPDYPYLITFGILLFAVADALAALAGESVSSPHHFVLIKDKKSWEGSATMFVASVAICTAVILGFGLYHFQPLYLLTGVVLSLSLLLTIIEMLSSHGSDNLFIPISGAIGLQILLTMPESLLIQFHVGLLLAIPAAFFSYRVRFLTASGAAITLLLATLIFGLGGLKWTVPILTFFVLSSLLSKAGKKQKLKFKDTFEKTGIRDYAQVLANGGIGGILILFDYFFPSGKWYQLYLLSLAVATADTWATEIGVYFNTKPRLITTFKRVQPGISGAVSLTGSIGAFMGSAVLVASAAFFMNRPVDFLNILLLILLGFLGSFIDSILGATIQAQYRCRICNKYTEKKVHCHEEAILTGGKALLGNDFVNISSTLIILFIFTLIA